MTSSWFQVFCFIFRKDFFFGSYQNITNSVPQGVMENYGTDKNLNISIHSVACSVDLPGVLIAVGHVIDSFLRVMNSM